MYFSCKKYVCGAKAYAFFSPTLFRMVWKSHCTSARFLLFLPHCRHCQRKSRMFIAVETSIFYHQRECMQYCIPDLPISMCWQGEKYWRKNNRFFIWSNSICRLRKTTFIFFVARLWPSGYMLMSDDGR